MTTKTVKYINRDYDSIKQDLLNFAKTVYGDKYNDFSEASIGMMLLEMVAHVGDMLSYHVDNKFNELFLDTAQNKDSILRLAYNLGYPVQGQKGSSTLVNLEIAVPVSGNSFDRNYALTFQTGMQLQSENGTIFEVLEDVNFDSETSFKGTPNREIIPQYSNNEISSYILRKQVVASAGESTTKSLEITTENAIPYLNWNLEDTDILSIRNMINSSTSSIPTTENGWVADRDAMWYETDYLGQKKVYIDTTTGETATTRTGYWKEVNKRFIKRYNDDDTLSLVFGAGIQDFDWYSDYLASGVGALQVAQTLSNSSLGVIPTVGQYMHCRYRKGGGRNSNVPANSITKVINRVVSNIPGGVSVDTATLNGVIGSLTANNPIPAIGGDDVEKIDTLRNKISKHFATQDRVVTIDDYISRAQMMPAQYGTIFRAYAENNTTTSITKLYILTLDENSKLKNSGNDLIKRNLAAYLEQYRLLNDIVEIHDGTIINIGIDFTVQVESGLNKQETIFNCIQALTDYFAIDKMNMNDTIYISKITDLLLTIKGVVNVANLTFKNKFGTNYSDYVLSSALQRTTQQVNNEASIVPVNNTITSAPSAMFEIKYPTRDIIGRSL